MNAPTPENADEPLFGRSLPRRHGWVAAVLSLIGPGLGHVYAGRGRRGLALVLGGLMAAVAAVFLSMFVRVPSLRVLLILVPFAVILGLGADAYRAAASARNPFWGKWYNRWYVYVGIWLAGVVLQPLVHGAIVGHVAQAFSIPSTAMEPTLLPGDYMLTVPIRTGSIGRGIPVVFQTPDGAYIQRVAAVPGDTVEMRRKVLFIDGRPRREPYVQHIDPATEPSDERMDWQEEFLAYPHPAYQPTRDNWGPLVVPDQQYLLLGDNRDNSLDGRYIGFVPGDGIRQRPVWIYFSRDAVEGEYRWSRLGRGIE
ncbi:MAG TPA: signal peptidase I [Longimicrobium sp.]|jgi:signal peptidase I